MIKKLKENKKLQYLLCSLLAIAVVSLGAMGIVKADAVEPVNVAPKAFVQVDVADDFTPDSTATGVVNNLNDNTTSTSYKYGFYKLKNVDEYLYFTLDDTYDLSRIVAKFSSGDSGNRIPEKYSMSVWNGKTWEEVGSKTDADAVSGTTTWDFGSQTKKATVVRLHVTQIDVKMLWINEIEIWGVKSDKKLTKPQIMINAENRALNAPQVEMAIGNSGFPATMLVDGKTWSHKNYAAGKKLTETTEDTITLTLKEASLIDSVVLYPAVMTEYGLGYNYYVGGFPVDFKISVYDGKAWVDVKTVTDQQIGAYKTKKDDLQAKRYMFDPIDATAVRITVTKHSIADNVANNYAIRLGEIQVNGVQSGKSGLLKPGETDPNQPVAKVKNPLRGTNMAVNADVSMSKCLGDFPSTKLVDNNVLSYNSFASTYGVKANDTQEQVTLVLQQSSKVQSIVLYPAIGKYNNNNTLTKHYLGGFPVDFKVEGYNGTEWIVLSEQVDQSVGEIGTSVEDLEIENYVFAEAKEVSAIRLTITKHSEIDKAGSGTYALRLSEIQVMGSKASTVIATPDGNLPELDQPAKEKNPITGKNMALNAKMEMNIPDWAKNEYDAGKLVDNTVLSSKNFATTNGLKETAEETITFTLAEASKLHSVVMYPAVQSGKYVGGFPSDFKVEGYDGSKWVELTTLANQSVGEVGTAIADLDVPNYVFAEAKEVSAVRITVTKHNEIDQAGSGKYALRLGEVQLMGAASSKSILKPGEVPEVPLEGANMALGADVEMATVADSKYAGSVLVDDKVWSHRNYAAGVNRTETAKDTIILAFKEPSLIHDVVLYPAVIKDLALGNYYIGGFPVNFTISVYDGEKWIEVKKVTEQYIGEYKTLQSKIQEKRYSFAPIDASGLKIEVTKFSKAEGFDNFAIRLGEIQAWGEKSAKTDMKKPTINAAGSAGSGTSGAGAYPNKLKAIDNNGNLALYRPTKASTHLGDYGAPTEKVNDGILTSYWASDDRKYEKGESQWVEVNLLNNFAINKVVLGARQLAYGFPNDMKIEVFYDGEWKVAHTVKGFVADEKATYCAYEFTFPAVIGNKVRITSDNFRKVDKANSMCITELAVYGNSVSGNYVLPNENMLTSGTAVTATSSMEDYDYFLINLTDNNLASGWSSVPTVTNEPQTIEIDMKGEVQLSEIQLKPAWGGHGFPIDFVISVFENGKWVDVYEAKDYEKPEDEAIQRFQFKTKKVTKFRITATKLAQEAGLYAFKLNEIMAFPSHTGDEFDPHSVKIVNSYEKPLAAEVVNPVDDADAERNAFILQTGKMIAGIAFIVIAIGGCATILILSNKKNKKK